MQRASDASAEPLSRPTRQLELTSSSEISTSQPRMRQVLISKVHVSGSGGDRAGWSALLPAGSTTDSPLRAMALATAPTGRSLATAMLVTPFDRSSSMHWTCSRL
jgi:hypothetical protein